MPENNQIPDITMAEPSNGRVLHVPASYVTSTNAFHGLQANEAQVQTNEVQSQQAYPYLGQFTTYEQSTQSMPMTGPNGLGAHIASLQAQTSPQQPYNSYVLGNESYSNTVQSHWTFQYQYTNWVQAVKQQQAMDKANADIETQTRLAKAQREGIEESTRKEQLTPGIHILDIERV